MPSPTTNELKKALLAEGFEIYRTAGSSVLLADRVRDNLILDSGVAAVNEDGALRVRFTVRAQRSEFPAELEEELYERARQRAVSALDQGYSETEHTAVPVHDPGDRTRTLDVWYEVRFEKPVADLAELVRELRYALSLDKAGARA